MVLPSRRLVTMPARRSTARCWLTLGTWQPTRLLRSLTESSPMASDSIRSFMEYSTSGQVGSTGVTGTPVISFNSVAAASFTAPSSFSLGEFLVAALPEGTSTSYSNTPFSITYLDQKVDGIVPTINETPVVLRGVLNGTVTGLDLANGTVSGIDVKKKSLTPAHFKPGSLPKGPAGPQGQPGPKGEQGQQGLQGAPGISARDSRRT